jgi:hypothetical protein
MLVFSRLGLLNQSQPLEAGVPVFADDNVVVDDNAGDDLLRHRNVGLRRRRIVPRESKK